MAVPFIALQAQENLLGQALEPEVPYGTELIGQKTVNNEIAIITHRRYSSRLSSEEIISFYRDFFLSQGFKEKKVVDVNPRKNNYTIPGQLNLITTFTRGNLKTVFLNIYYYSEAKDTTYYLLNETAMKYAITLGRTSPAQPQKLSFVPVVKDATQLWPLQKAIPTHLGVSYLVKGNVDSIISFYQREMAGFQWQLVGTYPREGKHNLYNALSAGLDLRESLKRIPKKVLGDIDITIEGNDLVYVVGGKRYSMDAQDIFPGVEATVKGVTLIFEKAQNKKCIININQFQDPSEYLREEKIIDPTYLEKYGNILINVEYFE
ncbi:MAG: hypothetical protein ABH865_01350 [Candidatus Omnitrophota bacterium]|nr:hypothetical protein [Candidatus Omnitrophota bacterium]